MQKYDLIEKGIADNDVATLREAIGSICYTNRNFSNGEFDEVVRYVETKGIKLKDDSLIGNPTISSQKQSFTDDDFARAVFELKKNFCDERIADVKRIGKALYPIVPSVPVLKPAQNSNPNFQSQQAGTPKNASSHQTHYEQNKSAGPLVIGLVAIAALITVAIVVIVNL